MAFLFFNPHELTKIVLKSSTKYNCTKLHYLVKRTEPKRFFLFSRGPPSNFFRHCETFFPEIFLLFCDRMDVGKSQKVPPFSFFGTVRFFSKNRNFSPFNFFDVLRQNPFNCDKNVDNFGSVPVSALQGLALAGPGAPLGPFF